MSYDYEFIYLTIHYACGHLAARAVRRYAEPQADPYEIAEDKWTRLSSRKCHVCKELAARAYERRIERMKGQVGA